MTLHIHPDVRKHFDVSRFLFKVTYFKTILGGSNAATTVFSPSEIRRIEVTEKRSIEARLLFILLESNRQHGTGSLSYHFDRDASQEKV